MGSEMCIRDRCWPKVTGSTARGSRRASDFANLLAQGWRMFYWYNTCRTESLSSPVGATSASSGLSNGDGVQRAGGVAGLSNGDGAQHTTPHSSQPRGGGHIYEFGISSPFGAPSSAVSAGTVIEDRVLQIYSPHNAVEENPRSVAMLMAHHYSVVCSAALRNPPAPVYPTFELGVSDLHKLSLIHI